MRAVARWLCGVAASALLVSGVSVPAALATTDGGPRIVSASRTGAATIEVVLEGVVDGLDSDAVTVQAPTTPWFAVLRTQQPDPGFVEVPVLHRSVVHRDGATIVTLKIGALPSPPRDLSSIPWYTGTYQTGDLTRDIQQADALLTWQLHGGWSKGMEEQYKRPWDGAEPRSTVFSVDGKRTELATIDNDATTNELVFLAHMYRATGYPRYRDAVRRAIDMLLAMQYPTGGWPQVYPARGNYSDYVTFNDDAMVRVMSILEMAAGHEYPFDTDVVSPELAARIREALERGVDYILKSQIRVDGVLTAWCAQHDPFTYEPREGRPYEHPSISGSESVGVLAYLMTLPSPSAEIQEAIRGALAWFERAKVPDTTYVRRDPQEQYFYHQPGSVIWYRFYDLRTNEPIFSGRDGVVKRDIREIEKERREGYAWATTKPRALLEMARSLGYYEGKLFVELSGISQGQAWRDRVAIEWSPES